jgi:hypothetical protein
MAWLADLSPCSDPGEYGALVLAVGWIDRDHDYTRGPVGPRFIGRLVELLEDPWQPRQTLGWHDCTLCRLSRGPRTFEYQGRVVKLGVNNLFVPAPDQHRLYIAPSFILHAMDAHGYAPPMEFVRAVRRCPPMRSRRYLEALSAVAPPWLVEAGPLPSVNDR